MAKFRLGELAKGKPAPEGTYILTVDEIVPAGKKDNRDGYFDKGSWGFVAYMKIDEGQNPEADNKMVFENLVIQDAEGKPSKAAFRFAQLAVAAYGTDDIEVDLEDKEAVTALVEGMVDKKFIGNVIIEPGDPKAGTQDRNQIKSCTAIVE